MPLISVIIPAYNSATTIKKTIESVLNQTFTDLELIVINDGSTDSTLVTVESIKDERLKVFSYPNSGVAESRNRGIALSKSDFISFIDADDLWTPDKLERQLRALQSEPKAAIAYSWTDWIDEKDNFLRAGSHITVNGDVYQQLLLRDFVESGSNPLILLTALKEVGGFDASLTNAHDWDMWLRLARSFEFVAVPSVQILYRISTNSMSTNVWGMEAASLKVIERQYNQVAPIAQHMIKDALASRYQYLTFKAIEGIPSQKKALASVRFFLLAVRYDPTWLLQKKTILIVLFKITVTTLLPSQQAEILLRRIKTKAIKSKNV